MSARLVLMMCGALAVPAAGVTRPMVAHATAGTPAVQAEPTGGAGAGVTTGTEKTPAEQLADAKKNALDQLADYYDALKDSVSADKKADFDKAKKDAETVISNMRTSEQVTAYLAKATAKLDTFVSSADTGDTTPDTTPTTTNNNIMVGGNWVTPVANAGQQVNVVLPVVNMGRTRVKNVVVTPAISEDAAKWPFEIETSNYSQTIDRLPGTDDGGTDMERRRELTWTLRTRKDAPSGYMPISFNVTFENDDMLGLCEQCIGDSLNSRQKSIIDRCVRKLYIDIARSKEKYIPVMSDFYDILMAQPEDEAKDIALSLELFVNGSLNIFNHQTNVDVDNRFTVYGIRDLGTELSPITMLVMMESIQNRIVENGKRGKATWLYIDEFHVLLNSEYSAKYLQQLWKKVRKQGGLCTGITQNVVDLLQNYTATTMLANSEFVALLKQANTDSSKMAEVIGVSEAQLRFVTNTASGMGLIKCGSVVIPFDNQISKDTDLYRLYNTNIHEKIAEQKKKEAMLQ